MEFDIQKVIEKTGLDLSLPGYKYLGVGNPLDKQLDENDNPLPEYEPVNDIDEAARKHDIFYRDNSDLKLRHESDKRLIKELEDIPKQNLSIIERLVRLLTIKTLQAKLTIGLGFTDEEWKRTKKDIRKLYAKEIHKQYKKSKNLRKVKFISKDNIWNADLITQPNDSGYKCILTVLDV